MARHHAYSPDRVARPRSPHQPQRGRISTPPHGSLAQARPSSEGTSRPQRQRPARSAARSTGRLGKSRYIPALDGLRAYAVLAVIFYHMGLSWAPGGLMGVTIFFVISGYLINGLLLAEHERTGTISLGRFWLRRIRRLFPAIVLAVVGTTALCTLFNPVLLDKMRADIVPSLLFYNNWWQVFHEVSYFEAAGSPSPLTHFWSLSIEEQFYVVWPLLLVAMFALRCRKRTMVAVVIVLALGSAVEMALLYDPQGDPSRIYYGTDTRAVSLLLGVLLAYLWPSAAFGERPPVSRESGGPWLAFNVLGAGSLVALTVVIAITNGFSGFPYYGGIVLTSLLSAAVIAVLAVPRTWIGKLLALKPLVWVGKRSYGIYLWHFPVLLLTTDANAAEALPWWMRLVQIGLTFGIAALSYKFVENPIRQGKLGEWWRSRQHGRRSPATPQAILTGGAFALLLVIACIGVFATAPTDYAATYAGQKATEPDRDAMPEASDKAQPDQGETASQVEQAAATRFDELFLTQHYNAAGQPLYEPLIIGDSVAASAEDEFYAAFPYGHVDAVVSRNIWESPYPTYRDAGQVGDYVVICLGTNNAVVDWQIDDELLNSVEEDKKVFMVTTRNNRSWMDSTNAEIARTPERHANVTIIDWYAASAGHSEYFIGDGTHLTEEGAKAYVALIKSAIEQSLEG